MQITIPPPGLAYILVNAKEPEDTANIDSQIQVVVDVNHDQQAIESTTIQHPSTVDVLMQTQPQDQPHPVNAITDTYSAVNKTNPMYVSGEMILWSQQFQNLLSNTNRIPVLQCDIMVTESETPRAIGVSIEIPMLIENIFETGYTIETVNDFKVVLSQDVYESVLTPLSLTNFII